MESEKNCESERKIQGGIERKEESELEGDSE